MVRLLSGFHPFAGTPPGSRRSLALTALHTGVGVGLCAVAGCALFVPEFIRGADISTAASAVLSAPAGTATAPATAQAPDSGSAPADGAPLANGIAPANGMAPANETAPGDPTASAGAADLWSSVMPAAATDSTASSGFLLATLPWGSADGQVGLAAPGEGLMRGPEALAVAPNGRLAILDSVNRRVVVLDASGGFVTSAPLTLAQPRFLAVTDDRLYVLDCDADRRLLVLDWNGGSLGELGLPELADVVTALFATDAGPAVEVAHENVFLAEPSTGGVSAAVVDADTADGNGSPDSDARIGAQPAHLRPLPGRPIGPDPSRGAKVTFEPGKSAKAKLFCPGADGPGVAQTSDRSLVVAPGRVVEYLVSVDGDGSGGMIVGASLLGGGTHGEPSLWLGRFGAGASTSSAPPGASGKSGAGAFMPLESLLLNDSPFAYLGQPYVVAPDGRIYQPVADKQGYRILVHGFCAPATVTR